MYLGYLCFYRDKIVIIYIIPIIKLCFIIEIFVFERTPKIVRLGITQFPKKRPFSTVKLKRCNTYQFYSTTDLCFQGKKCKSLNFKYDSVTRFNFTLTSDGYVVIMAERGRRVTRPSNRMQNSYGLRIGAAERAREYRDRIYQEGQQSLVYDNQYSTWRSRCGDAVNRDAKRYHDMLNMNTRFVDCAVCGIEESICKVTTKVDILSNTAFSGFLIDLASKRSSLVSVHGAYGATVEDAFDNHGMLRHSTHVCLKCKKRMQYKTVKPDQANTTTIEADDDDDGNHDHVTNTHTKPESKVFALMHGLFCGPIPMELECLNYIELSLVSQINVITRVNVHTKYIHSMMKSFSVLNTVHDVVKQLPC